MWIDCVSLMERQVAEERATYCAGFLTDSYSKMFSNLFSHFLLSKFYSKNNRGRDLRMDNVEKIGC